MINLRVHNQPWNYWMLDEFLTPECLAEVKNIKHKTPQLVKEHRGHPDRLFISNINVDSQRAKYPNLCDLADELQHGQLKKFFENIVKAKMPNFMRIEVISDIGPFYLKPHNDFLKKLTILCYTNYSALYPGTTIYSDANTIHHQIESQDNRCVFYVPNYVTWHGVPKTVFPTVRRMLMINYFVSLDQLSPPQLN